MTRVALLDVNVLVALFDPDHIHHDPAHDWLAAHRPGGWATCPITENGLVRILSNASYSGEYVPAADVRKRLFDRHIPSRAVIGADKDHLQLIPA